MIGAGDVDGLDELREIEALGDRACFNASTVRKLVELKIRYRERAEAAEAERDAAVRRARAGALEEAAREVERGPVILCDGIIDAVAMMENRATKIRALKAESRT